MEMQSYRKRSRISFPKLMAIIIAAAAVLLVIALVVAYMCGVRYITSETGDGLKVRFFGTVDSDGNPKSGMLSYSDGKTGKITEDGSIYYSSGDVYTGELEGMLKHGKGKLTGANGDVYEGEFAYDVINGTGILTASGNTFEGSFVDGKFDGEGVYTS